MPIILWGIAVLGGGIMGYVVGAAKRNAETPPPGTNNAGPPPRVSSLRGDIPPPASRRIQR